MQQPNFLIFCTDQQRADHLGCMDNPIVRTPNIDAIAELGTRFTHTFCSSPVCMCARATMFTGLSNRGNNMRRHGLGLPEDIPTLPGLLAKAGYRTHSAGKLHLKPWGPPKGVTLDEIERPGENSERRFHWSNGHLSESPDNYYGFQTQDLVIGHGNYAIDGGDYATWIQREAPEQAEKYRIKPEF